LKETKQANKEKLKPVVDEIKSVRNQTLLKTKNILDQQSELIQINKTIKMAIDKEKRPILKVLKVIHNKDEQIKKIQASIDTLNQRISELRSKDATLAEEIKTTNVE